MKSITKKITASILAATIALSFAACNNSDTPSNTDGNEVHKLKLLGSLNQPAYVKFDDKKDFASWKKFEDDLKKLNIELDFELIVKEQYATTIQTRMASASNKLPDIVNLSPLDDTTALNLGKQGRIIKINEAIKSFSDGSIEKRFSGDLEYAKKLTTAPDGNRYWIPTAITSNDVKLENGKVTQSIDIIGSSIRKDWLDKLKIPMPTTIDQWKDALVQFRKKDANGNGVQDEVLIFDSYSYSFFTGIAQWFGLVPDIAAVDPNTDKVVSPWNQPGAKDYFKLMRDLAKEGIFDVSLVGATDEVFNQRIAENKVSGMRSYAVATWFEDLIKTTPDAEYHVVKPLSAVNGVTPMLLADAPKLCFDKYAITSNCKDVKGAIKLFDYMCTDEYLYVSNNGIKDADFTLAEDGKTPIPTKEYKGMSNEQLYNAKRGSIGPFVNNAFLPRIMWSYRAGDIKTAIEQQKTEKAKREFQVQIDLLEYRPFVTSPFSSSMYAIASPEEVDVINKYHTTLKTYSEELAMKLILGTESIDDWDKHIEKLNKLGLNEITKVYQARYDRYKSAK